MSFMGSFDFSPEGLAPLSPAALRRAQGTVQPRHPTRRRAPSTGLTALDDDHFNIFAVDLEPFLTEIGDLVPPKSRPAPDPARLARLDQRRGRLKDILETARQRRVDELEAEWRSFEDLRSQFWVEDEEVGPSPALRLAVHAINYTVAFVALPVGAAMMTYSFLRGEDMRITARLTTMSGMAMVALQANPGAAQILGM